MTSRHDSDISAAFHRKSPAKKINKHERYLKRDSATTVPRPSSLTKSARTFHVLSCNWNLGNKSLESVLSTHPSRLRHSDSKNVTSKPQDTQETKASKCVLISVSSYCLLAVLLLVNVKFKFREKKSWRICAFVTLLLLLLLLLPEVQTRAPKQTDIILVSKNLEYFCSLHVLHL